MHDDIDLRSIDDDDGDDGDLNHPGTSPWPTKPRERPPQDPPVEFASEACGRVGTDRLRTFTVTCTQPKGHKGKHGGGGCEWNDAACVDGGPPAPAATPTAGNGDIQGKHPHP